jgi:ketosteroid isomerase-like protein
MSQANEEIVREGYAAWNRNDLDGVLAILTPGFEFRPLPGFFDLKEVYRGREGFTSFWETWFDAWETMEIRIERIEDLENRVLALVRFEGIGRTSTVPVSLDAGHLWTLRKGQVVELIAMPVSEALEAAGLRE